MIQLTTSSNELSARYYLVQHTPDVMRKETLNVGVIVEKGESRAAWFLGEREPAGEIDRRSLRSVSDHQVYKMWVRHWRKWLNTSEWQAHLLDPTRETFSFLPAGEVTDTGTDTASQIANYLFSMLVSGGGLQEATSSPELDAESVVHMDLLTELRRRKITPSTGNSRHPVYEGREVRGESMWHPIAFYQELGKEAWAFDSLNLATRYRQHVRERAGYLAFVFSDIRRRRKREKKVVNTTAVVTVTDEYRDEEHVKYALGVIRNNADVIYTNEGNILTQFLNEREAVAAAA
jgi:hypothetical protein